MIVRLLRNPFVVVLAGLVLLAVLASVWSIGVVADDRGVSWSGEPSDEVLWRLRLSRLANFIPAPATLVAVLAVLGLVVIGAVSSRRRGADRPRDTIDPAA